MLFFVQKKGAVYVHLSAKTYHSVLWYKVVTCFRCSLIVVKIVNILSDTYINYPVFGCNLPEDTIICGSSW